MGLTFLTGQSAEVHGNGFLVSMLPLAAKAPSDQDSCTVAQ